MSEAKHTAGKLDLDEIDDGTVWAIRDESGFAIAKCWHFDREKYDYNARRLVAAWNACEDLSTEALESGAVGELLAACRLAKIELAYLIEQVDARKGGSVDRVYQACKNAIEKAEGNK